MAISYWSIQGVFISDLVRNAIALQAGFFSGSGEAQLTKYAFGTVLPESTVPVAVVSLVSTDGIYFITLVAMFCLGIIGYAVTPNQQQAMIPFVFVGAVSAAVIFKTPLASDGIIIRARLPLAVFFSFVLGIGLYRFSGISSDLTMRKLLILSLIISLGVTAPMTAGIDLYELHAGPDLYELRPMPEPQKEFSEAEYDRLSSVSEFVETYSLRTSTFHATNRAVEHFTGERLNNPSIRRNGIRVDKGLFIYRTHWTQHTVSNSSGTEGERSAVIMSDEWLNSTISGNHKIYTTGQVGALYANKPVILASENSTNLPQDLVTRTQLQ
jgi:hypothetical protein